MIPYQMMYRTIGFFLLISVSFTECKMVHELMTADEIRTVFHTNPEEIPDYEMVEIEHSLHKRSSPQDFRFKFNAFDTDVDAYLDPIEGVLVGEKTPVWVAELSNGRPHYRRLKEGIMKDVLGVYQSVTHEAALVVRSVDGQELQFHGTVRNLSIAPLPARVQRELRKTYKRKRDLSTKSRTMRTTDFHVIYRSNPGINQQSTESTVEKKEEILKQIDASRSKRSYKDIVFPTILVTTDFDITVNSRDDSAYYDQLMYEMAFFNAVDLKYRNMTNPQVRIRVAGFILGAGRSATPYMHRNMINNELDASKALQDMQAYWDQMSYNGEISTEAFHIVATVTNVKMFGKDKSGTKMMLGGLAGLSSICIKYESRFYPSTIFRDDGGFGGVNTAVHEIGHILGAYHDEQAECPASDGYLMSPMISSSVNNPKWSKCSTDRIEKTLRKRDCVDKPREHYPPGKPLDRILPGTLKTTHEQCQARGYDWACATTPEICRVLRCYYTGFYGFFATLLMCQNSRSAAEGTECAPGSYCIDGECKHP